MILRAVSQAHIDHIVDVLARASVLSPSDAARLRNGGIGLIVLGSGEPEEVVRKAACQAGARAQRRRAREERITRARALMLHEGHSLRSASVEVGIAASTLSEALQMGATPGRKAKLGTEDVRRARGMLEDGRTMREVASTLGVAESTLRRTLKADGRRRQAKWA